MSGKYRWDKKYLYWGIIAFAVIAGSIAFYLLLSKWPGIKAALTAILRALSPFIYGCVFAYLFIKVVNYFERAFLHRLGERLFPKNAVRAFKAGRIFSIFLTLASFAVVFGGIMWLIMPQIYYSLSGLVNNMSTYYRTVITWIDRFFDSNPELEAMAKTLVGNISDNLTKWVQESILPRTQVIITNITSGVFSVVREMFNILIGVVASVYIMYHKETFSAQAKKLLYSRVKPRRANRVLSSIRFVDRACGGFIIGKLIDSLIIGIICYIVLTILKMPYSALVSVIVCVTNIIPFFGPFIGAVPSALLILLESPMKCLIFIIFIIVLQQIDGNILGPKILGTRIGLSGFWIMFAILLFGGLFSLWGMLLGVPVFAVIYAAIRNINTRRLIERDLPTATADYLNISYIDPITNSPVYKDPVRTVDKKPARRKK